METNIQFSSIKSREEFFLIFQGLCNIAELAFNKFEKEPDEHTPYTINRHASYLMDITYTIMGMRGDYQGFRDSDLLSPFFIEIDGIQYDQKYLYKMNDYFRSRLDKVFDILEKVDPKSYKLYNSVLKKH